MPVARPAVRDMEVPVTEPVAVWKLCGQALLLFSVLTREYVFMGFRKGTPREKGRLAASFCALTRNPTQPFGAGTMPQPAGGSPLS